MTGLAADVVSMQSIDARYEVQPRPLSTTIELDDAGAKAAKAPDETGATESEQQELPVPFPRPPPSTLQDVPLGARLVRRLSCC